MLAELQARLRDALLAGADGAPLGALADRIADDGLGAAARVAIYRHHVLTTLTAVLRSTFPVVHRLVGDGFFGYAADTYVRRDPPRGPCLLEYGAGFGPFLAAFPPCRELVYLADVARLEWAMHAAFHAPDVAPLARAALARVPEPATPHLTFALHPGATFLESPWPVDRIWRANRPGPEEGAAVDLAEGGVRLEIRRLGDDAVFRSLTPADFAFRRALAASATLEVAAAAALSLEAEFDLTAAFRALLDDELVVGYGVAPPVEAPP